MNETRCIMIVGVGGQGTLLASRILGNLLTGAGYDVKVSEIHGMSQRGGSVVTYVRYGEKVYSPIIDKGEADIIISRRPCALLKYVKHPGPIEAKPEKCVGCKSCMKLGCPAISVTGGKVQIDNTLCTGCGLCRQLCHKGALGE